MKGNHYNNAMRIDHIAAEALTKKNEFQSHLNLGYH